VGDINQYTDWSVALNDVECVVHLAGLAHVMKPTAEDERRFYEVNVLGTERLAFAAANQGVRRFVFLSSVKVNGESTFDQPFTASDPCNPSDDYGKSKYRAEQVLFDIAKKTGMEVIVIRPPLIYGPGVRANFLKLLSWVYGGIPLPLGCVKNARSLVSVWNLCDLIRTIIEVPRIASGVLMVSDGVDLSTPSLIKHIARAMNKVPRLMTIPVPILKLAGTLAGKSAEVSRLCGSLAVDISDVKQQLCWTPPLSIEEGMSQTAKWYMKMLLEQHE
jgi:UDP-glucose 4-epimerase